VLDRCSILVDGVRSDDGAAIAPSDVVDVLPPFAGG
jgi:molybdopterin synthase sulfur carrier subunit